MKERIILHLCADIGSDSKPYREAGYDVRCVGREIGIENYTPPENVYGIIANPPCTHFSIARTVAKTPRDLNEGMRLVKECQRIIWACLERQYQSPSRTMPLKFWTIENPATGFLRWFLGKPSFEYCPSEFGADFTKKTALWGCFTPPHRPFMEYIHKRTYSQCSRNDRATSIIKYSGTHAEKRLAQMNDRSKCYEPFAKAFFEVNQ